jgi:hypothetical protein
VLQFSQAIVTTIYPSCPRQKDLTRILKDLAMMETHPSELTEAVYEWCSVVCENYLNLVDGKNLLLLSLKIGFRHLNPQTGEIEAKFTHMNHQKMSDVIFGSGNAEAIADLLHAWISQDKHAAPPIFLEMCAQHLIGLHNMQPFSLRLQQLVIRSIGFIGYQVFEQVGVEGFVELLNSLCVGFEDISICDVQWGQLLQDIIQSPNGIQHLSLQYWEILVEIEVQDSLHPAIQTNIPHIMTSLEASKEWDKLECWVAVVWMKWPLEESKTTEEDLEHVMLSLSHQQPGTIQKLKQRMEKWSKRRSWNKVPESFYQICAKVEQDVL